jgi:hypothetical protein
MLAGGTALRVARTTSLFWLSPRVSIVADATGAWRRQFSREWAKGSPAGTRVQRRRRSLRRIDVEAGAEPLRPLKL